MWVTKVITPSRSAGFSLLHSEGTNVAVCGTTLPSSGWPCSLTQGGFGMLFCHETQAQPGCGILQCSSWDSSSSLTGVLCTPWEARNCCHKKSNHLMPNATHYCTSREGERKYKSSRVKKFPSKHWSAKADAEKQSRTGIAGELGEGVGLLGLCQGRLCLSEGRNNGHW